MDVRRIKLLGLAKSRLRYILHLLKKQKFKMAWNHLWVGLFTYDAGIALLDPVYKIAPFLVGKPHSIEVEITTRCNLKCIMCEHTYWHEPPRDMTFEDFRRIVEPLKLKWINVTGIGESFLNKDFLKMLEWLKSRDIFVEIVDTFFFIDEKTALRLIEMGLDRITVSMDAARKETYEKIRPGSDFDRVLTNIQTFARIKKERGAMLPEVWFHYVINSINIGEIHEYIELVRGLVAETNYATMITFSNLLKFKEIEDIYIDPGDEFMAEVEKKAMLSGIYVNWMRQNLKWALKEDIRNCMKWTVPFILVTGHMQPCCIINEANDREHQKKYAFGNVFEKGVLGIWKSQAMKEFRKKLRRNETPEICRHCRVFKHSR